MHCRSRQELEALLNHELDLNSQRITQQHIAGCSSCAVDLEEVAANLSVADSLSVTLASSPTEVGGEAELPKLNGDYRIVREIGRGGMGIVYEAQQANPRRSVAVKVLHGSVCNGSDRLKRFRREARALARLRHPNIAAIYAVGQASDGQHYIVMELGQGRPLDQFMQTEDITVTQRLGLFRQICEAINYIHQRGVIHLDIKPSNILVDSKQHVRILDFGLARIVDPDATMTTGFIDSEKLAGTLPYMSPEQLTGDLDTIDLRSDVYSLGVILYELLTGRRPVEFKANMPHFIYRNSPTKLPAIPSRIDRSLRGDLETIMLKAIEQDPSRRYQSALALAEDLHRFETNQPILARPTSGLYHFRKLVSRHKMPFALVTSLAVVLIGFSVWMSAMYTRAQKAERMAQVNLTSMIAAKDQAETQATLAQEANHLAQERLDEAQIARRNLEIVSKFQADMLQSVNPAQIGQNIQADLRGRFQKAGKTSIPADLHALGTTSSMDDMLAQIDWTEIGSKVIHQNILQPALVAIKQNFSKQYRIKSDLLTTIGYIYQQLADLDRAEENMSAAHEIRERELGDTHPDTLTTELMLARIYQLQGKFGPAVQMFKNVLECRRKIFGDNHLDTARAKLALGNLYRHFGRLSDAETLCSEALQSMRRYLGDEHIETLDAMNVTSELLIRRDKHSEAYELLQNILNVRLQTLGTNHLDTLVAKNNLGHVLIKLDRQDEAEPLYVEALSGMRQILGETHPTTLMLISNLGFLYCEQGRYNKAEPYYVEALQARRRILGNENLDTIQSINNMAAFYSNQQRPDEAETLYKEAFETSRRVLGAKHPMTLTIMLNLGVQLAGQQLFDEAEPLIEQTLKVYRQRFGPKHSTTIEAMISLADVRRHQQRYVEAEALYLEAFAGSKDHWQVSWHRAIYGQMLCKLKRYEEAEILLLEAYQIIEKAIGKTGKQTMLTANLIVELYEAWDKPVKANNYLAVSESDAP